MTATIDSMDVERVYRALQIRGASYHNALAAYLPDVDVRSALDHLVSKGRVIKTDEGDFPIFEANEA